MDKVSVLIIEDTPAQSDALVKVLLSNSYEVAGVATTYSEALNLFYANKVDVVIIDIFLNGNPEGITFAETINVVPNASKPFVFLTSSNDRQIFERAKLTRPFSFLMKPFNELEILYAIEMAVEKFHDQNDVFFSDEQDTVISSEFLFIKKGKALKKVHIAEIVYIEVEERYCNIITENEKFVILISLTKILELLDTSIFCRTHRNFIVNTEKIIEIIPSDNLIVLSGNHKAILSDKYKNLINNLRILK
ncbi:LytTR family DNA-binding domain-containing protein [Flavobacterium sp. K5-23]|uniref:LytR/AlgR family response regulator transcription factor n=1 Tax=Flavobacterium sp. K5-23 TaxID=2746225 RepID=UPI00200FDACB|nr:response regulator transcription factor [Flavobacterium sp. K5-23]UQD56215.1 response regulator transcription factor [Flavobacterium sp. K5-23]